MARLKLAWTATAVKQRNSIFNYWNKRNRNLDYSKKILFLINQRTNNLTKYPELGKSVDFPNTRAISISHFSLFYKQQNQTIIITAFWDNRDDPKKLLNLLP